jgi:hypothetical protein
VIRERSRGVGGQLAIEAQEGARTEGAREARVRHTAHALRARVDLVEIPTTMGQLDQQRVRRVKRRDPQASRSVGDRLEGRADPRDVAGDAVVVVGDGGHRDLGQRAGERIVERGGRRDDREVLVERRGELAVGVVLHRGQEVEAQIIGRERERPIDGGALHLGIASLQQKLCLCERGLGRRIVGRGSGPSADDVDVVAVAHAVARPAAARGEPEEAE